MATVVLMLKKHGSMRVVFELEVMFLGGGNNTGADAFSALSNW
jgi:hypothetical protein